MYLFTKKNRRCDAADQMQLWWSEHPLLISATIALVTSKSIIGLAFADRLAIACVSKPRVFSRDESPESLALRLKGVIKMITISYWIHCRLHCLWPPHSNIFWYREPSFSLHFRNRQSFCLGSWFQNLDFLDFLATMPFFDLLEAAFRRRLEPPFPLRLLAFIESREAVFSSDPCIRSRASPISKEDIFGSLSLVFARLLRESNFFCRATCIFCSSSS